MKRPRLKKWAKWACTVAAVLAVSAAVLSRFYGWRYATTSNSDNTLWAVAAKDGQIVVSRVDFLRIMNRKPPLGWIVRWSPHWYWGYSGESGTYGTNPPWNAGVYYTKDTFGWDAGVSVLYPVAMTLIPASLLWYADRRRFKPGACAKCGYDRSGIAADALCPECGKPAL